MISLIENWKKSLDKKGYGGAVLMDLSMAFDTIKYDLLVAKLHAYGFSKKALTLILNYLSNRWNRTKIYKDFSTWQELLQGVPQGSALGPLLFNIYLNDLFFLTESTEVCNFADDTTLYACDQNLNDLINRLEHDSFLAIEWFENNSMKLNDDKCENKYENVWAQIGNSKIWESKAQKLLGVEIDRTLNFDEHVKSLCKNAGRKLSVLSRLSNYMNVKQKKILMKSFFESQFGYCPLVWMFYSRGVNNKINHLHEWALRIIYKDNSSSFENLLEKDGSCSIHHRNIQSLAIELFKIKTNVSNDIIYDIFNTREIKYNLRSQTDFSGHCVNTIKFGINSLKFFATKVWEIVPFEIKILITLRFLKVKFENGSQIVLATSAKRTYTT